jgi:uncharacterized protein
VETTYILLVAFFAVAVLYTSVGHAGASGYLAIMALAGVAPATMRPTALALNIVVALITVARFSRAGYFDWRNLWPFLVGSIPLAALGGSWKLANHAYYVVVALALLAAALVLFWRAFSENPGSALPAPRIPVVPAVAIGAAIGLLSGLTGTGGGIFLSPLILLAGWASPKHTSGISAPFILVNSTVALIAGQVAWASLPGELPWFILVVVAGATVGTWLGLRRLSTRGLVAALGAVLLLAAAKLVLTR